MSIVQDRFTLDYPAKRIGSSLLVQTDCFEWMSRAPEATIHAIVTDPPYGVKEYDLDQLTKRTNGRGGIWRLPPDFDGHQRSPLPRFTALNEKERCNLRHFFVQWGQLAARILRPGGHLVIASNAFLSQMVFSALVEAKMEFRGEIVRLVRTLRGGDRPKNAEKEFPGVSSMPRGCYEPWGVFRKPMPSGFKVSDCLREFQTGGLRRRPNGLPFEDVIDSERTSQLEKEIADHPSLKPQSFLRQIVHAVLPLGEGIVLDPFTGSGSTIAAAEAVGYTAIGIERIPEFFSLACKAIPRLSRLVIAGPKDSLCSLF
ncbi:MAG: site-specific DNA-methyltransferase [Planctomycetia bacterium]|nr:site-specific DNA-methyltransferase [Planctomycetia bacterium]